jgi:predicted transglutaminase-like cysteine proteinase
MPLSIAAIGSFESSCARSAQIAPAAGEIAPAQPVSKSQAILGGTMSALDRIRAQQASLEQPQVSVIQADSPVGSAPAACSALQLPTLAVERSWGGTAPDATTFLATNRIAIGKTAFNAKWARVSGAHLSREKVQALVGTHAVTDPATLQDVNRWVNRSITHVEDRVLWGSRDYWATATETLNLHRGDCEDVAILKYQMLQALGVDEKDMYLTLARDLARNADHAILIVRQDGRWYMLDNATDAILPAGDLSYDYRPTLSFNSESAWLHGARIEPRRQPQQQFAYLSVSAMSKPRVIGFSR